MVQHLTHRAHASSAGLAAPDGGHTHCHGVAALLARFRSGQAGSIHPHVVYRVARLSVSAGRHKTRNGAGKTTTVRILATLTRADAGQARVAGFDVLRDRSAVRRRISLTGQFAALDEAQTGEENLRMMGRLSRLSRAAARRRAAELIDLDDADPGRVLIASFAVRGATLDDVFLTLTGHMKETIHV